MKNNDEEKKIRENISCWQGLDDEVLRLHLLFSTCECQLKIGGEELISRRYILEMITNLIAKHPILLDPILQEEFIKFKMGEL